jgi:ABC-type dipeptide/oligopeptide/nickel transport system permease component
VEWRQVTVPGYSKSKNDASSCKKSLGCERKLPTSSYDGAVVAPLGADVLDSEFVIFARAKGVGPWTIIAKHALSNAIISPLTFSGLLLAGFITGSVVVETVFSWPGIGRLAITAVFDNDFPVLSVVVFLFTVMYVVTNLIVDVLYAVIDPRIRLA